MPRTLVTKSRNIGDVLLTGPLVSALHRHAPQNPVDVLVKRGTEAMLAGHPHLAGLDTFPERRAGEGALPFLWRQLRFLLTLRRAGYTLALNTTEGERGALAGYASGAAARAGLHNRKKGRAWHRLFYTRVVVAPPGRRHTVIRNLDLLPEGVADYRRVHLHFEPRHLEQAHARLAAAGWDGARPLVQVHPTSRWFFKCWEDAPMAAAIDHLQRTHGVTVVLTSGPGDQERSKLDAILAHCTTAPLDLGGALSLKELAALASLCRLYFGVDTAPMHMAAALDVPVVALFGPSGAFDWGPWPNDWAGDATPYPERNGVQRSAPHVVIQKGWECAPCGRDGCDGSKESRCLKELTLNEVLPHLDASMEAALAGDGR